MDEDRIGFACLMLAFAALLLIAAGIMRLTKSPFLFVHLNKMKVRDKQEFAVQASKAIALCAAAPAAGISVSECLCALSRGRVFLRIFSDERGR